MNQYDVQYRELTRKILQKGEWDEGDIRSKWADGTPAHAKSLLRAKLEFDNTQVPILTTKYVGWKTAIKEMLLFWQKKTNKITDMHKMGVDIWDEWEKEDGTIGNSYGYQLGLRCLKLPISEYDKVRELADLNHFVKIKDDHILVDQVDYLLHQLMYNKNSRRHVTSLWKIDDLDDMALKPCVWATKWMVRKNRLHLVVHVRSSDMLLGNPYNVFQYYILQRMVAQVTGYELGTLEFDIADVHIYDRHIPLIEEQVERRLKKLPTLWVNPEVKNFYDFTPDDFRLENYEHGPKVEAEVAI